MSLQLALTQLESLAETLNERKREAEQHHAVREVLKHLGKFSFKSSADRDHYLLRQDDVVQLVSTLFYCFKYAVFKIYITMVLFILICSLKCIVFLFTF